MHLTSVYLFLTILTTSYGNCLNTRKGKQISQIRSKRDASSNLKKSMINCMNKYRAKHHAGPLKEAAWLSKIAQTWAEHLSASRTFDHQKANSKFGENMYSYWSSGRQTPKADLACNAWYDEIKLYDFRKGHFSTKTGHFTQLVWKGSRDVGLGVAEHNGRWIIVADYYPPGNIHGEFQTNVLPSLK